MTKVRIGNIPRDAWIDEARPGATEDWAEKSGV